MKRGSNKKLISCMLYNITDAVQYVNVKSCHPCYTKNCISFNLARNICTMISNFVLREELKTLRIKQEYPIGLIASSDILIKRGSTKQK